MKKKTERARERALAPDPYSPKMVISNAFARAFRYYLGSKTCKTLGLYSSLEPSNLSLILVLTSSGPPFPGCTLSTLLA